MQGVVSLFKVLNYLLWPGYAVHFGIVVAHPRYLNECWLSFLECLEFEIDYRNAHKKPNTFVKDLIATGNDLVHRLRQLAAEIESRFPRLGGRAMRQLRSMAEDVVSKVRQLNFLLLERTKSQAVGAGSVMEVIANLVVIMTLLGFVTTFVASIAGMILKILGFLG